MLALSPQRNACAQIDGSTVQVKPCAKTSGKTCRAVVCMLIIALPALILVQISGATSGLCETDGC